MQLKSWQCSLTMDIEKMAEALSVMVDRAFFLLRRRSERSRQMNIHIVEVKNRFVKLKSDDYEYRSPQLDKINAEKLVGGDIYFHKTRSEPSFYGGRIIDYRLEIDEAQRGMIVFILRYNERCRNVKTDNKGWSKSMKITDEERKPMAQDLLDHWVNLIKSIFPAHAWMAADETGNNHVIQIDWRLDDESKNDQKRSRKIQIIIRQDAIDDYLDKKPLERDDFNMILKEDISERFDKFDAAHGSKRVEVWSFSKEIMEKLIAKHMHPNVLQPAADYSP